jgi:hypothetical protein
MSEIWQGTRLVAKMGPDRLQHLRLAS